MVMKYRICVESGRSGGAIAEILDYKLFNGWFYLFACLVFLYVKGARRGLTQMDGNNESYNYECEAMRCFRVPKRLCVASCSPSTLPSHVSSVHTPALRPLTDTER